MPDVDFGRALDGSSGTAQRSQGMTINTFLASLATALIVFGVELLLFLLLKGKLTRIYQPRTYLVPDRERTAPSPPGLFRWIIPVFKTSNAEFIQKCGLDAYFFLRYLRMLLKIFVPLSFLLLPVLIPLNKVGGKDNRPRDDTQNGTTWNVTGLDQLAWGNVDPHHTGRYWGHLIMAVVVVVYVCAVFFDELRGYIRLRQAYLTSPQHRLRASATTVLVTAIPERWLSVEALDALYDVFPGGIRNIWINRNFDELSEKVKLRNKLALMLESAETELIKKCKKAQLKQAKAEAKKAGKSVKEVEAREMEAAQRRISQMNMNSKSGISSGDPHQIAHSVGEAVKKNKNAGTHARNASQGSSSSEGSNTSGRSRRSWGLIPVVEEGLDVIEHGIGKLGKTVLEGLKKVEDELDDRLHGGYVPDADLTVRRDSRVGDGIGPAYRLQTSSDDDHAGAIGSSVERQGEQNEQPTGGAEKPRSEAGQPFWKKMSIHSKQTGKSNAHRYSDEYPLTRIVTSESTPGTKEPEKKQHGSGKEGDEIEGQEYPLAYNEEFEGEDLGEPLWKKYIKEKDRETMRLPLFGLSWMPSLPFIGKKVDTIDYCRKEVARLNLEIEIDQQHPERFPLMNSAFIQFNHQVAAHMACQAVSHHIPKQMAPRIVEISPDDVIWDNMSIKWWERYLRTFGVMLLVSGMVIGWAFPVAFTGLLSQLSYLEGKFTWLAWMSKLPPWIISAVQGILPPLVLAILMALLPLMLRFLSRTQGVHTGMAVELTVQNYYFAFLFVQLFLVVSISSSFSTIFESVTNVTSWPELLAQNIPKASNYFFSYMILQAMSVSAGALVQIFNLISWFILAPIMDNTARMKWARTTNLNQMQWGTFFPVYTTLASIGLIYCVIAPLIMVFNVITFSLFWFVYRYNTLYVTKFRFDTGGLLFPKAINQLFTGLYLMELCLIGMFFLVRDAEGEVACEGQAICMIIVLILTIAYQYLLNEAFNPLFRYLPITLEDEAVKRDEEFARAQRIRLGLEKDDNEQESIEDQLAEREREERAEDKRLHDIELKNIEEERERRKHHTGKKHDSENKGILGNANKLVARQSWADRSRNTRSKYFGGHSDPVMPTVQRMREKLAHDAEAQGPSTNTIGHALFAGIHDELEDLTPEERDVLVQRAFQHEALRAKRPVIWIPRDDLGVSDDEIYRTQRFSKHIWISNEYQALDAKCRPVFSRSPPDFSEVDLIQL